MENKKVLEYELEKTLDINDYIEALINGDEEKQLEFIGKVEIIEYLPVTKKDELLQAYVNSVIDTDKNYKYVNTATRGMFHSLVLLKHYTNIKGSGNDNYLTSEEYDQIMMLTQNQSFVIDNDNDNDNSEDKVESKDNQYPKDIFWFILLTMKNIKHIDYDFVQKAIISQAEHEVFLINQLSTVVSEKIDKVLEQLDPKEWNKVIKTAGREMKKAKDNGVWDKIETMISNIGVKELIADFQRGMNLIISKRNKVL
jgi:hypothetical protein